MSGSRKLKLIPQRNRKPWTLKDKQIVAAQAKTRTVREIAKTLRRTLAAVQQYALRAGISFRA